MSKDNLPNNKINDAFFRWMQNKDSSDFMKLLGQQTQHNQGSVVDMQPLNINDTFGRPLYADKDGNFYCDNNMDIYNPDIHFWDGEPVYRMTKPRLNRELHDSKSIHSLMQKAQKIARSVK